MYNSEKKLQTLIRPIRFHDGLEYVSRTKYRDMQETVPRVKMHQYKG